MDALTAAVRIGGTSGAVGSFVAAPKLREQLGDTGVAVTMAGAGVVSFAACGVEFAHFGMSSNVRPVWNVAADEGITKGWAMLGVGSRTRIVGLATAMAAGFAIPGLGFGASRGSD